MKISEDADLAELLAEEQAAQRFGDADQEAADRRADEAAHAAQHDDGEGDQHEGVARLRRDVEGRHQQARRGAEAGDADAVGDGEDVLDVDADQPRALALLGDRADRLAGVGAWP